MKILILYPELQLFRHKHLGVSILAGILKRDGHDVNFFNSSFYSQDKILPDMSMREKELMPLYWFKKSKYILPQPDTVNVDVVNAFNKKLDDFQPKVILVTTTFLSFGLGAKIISLSNARNHMVIHGGIHCTISPEQAIMVDGVKHIHIGEAEISLPIIMQKLQKNEAIDNCNNLWVKKDNGQIIKNSMENIIDNIDGLPFYNWDIFNNDYYFMKLFLGKPYRMADYSLSRGCLHRCTYCFYKNFSDVYDIKNIVRRYSPERAIEELIYLKERYNLTFVKFHDSDFLSMGASYLEKFSFLYRKYVNLPNALNACVEHVTEQKAKYLVRMNCRSVLLGLESGSEDIRQHLLNRQYTNKIFAEKVRLLKKAGLRIGTTNLIGLPGETRQDMMETIDLNKKVKPDHPDFNVFYPFPKLSLTNYAIEKGYMKKDKKIDHYIFGLESPLEFDISSKELRNIYRCATLYAKLPLIFRPLIKYAEKHNTDHGTIWRLLRSIYFFKIHFLDFPLMLREIKRRYFFSKSLLENKK